MRQISLSEGQDMVRRPFLFSKAFGGVLVLILAHALINWIWLWRDTFPLWFDYGGYFQRSLEYHHAAQAGFTEFLKTVGGYSETGTAYLPYRLFLPLSSVPWYFLFGANPDTAVMSCTFYLAIALLSVYGMGAKLFNERAGFWAAFVLSTSSGFFIFYRRYSPEFASAAWIALFLYLYIMSGDFQKRIYSVLLGFSLGLAMLTKELPLAYAPGVAIYAVYRFFTGPAALRERSLVNAGLALLVLEIMVFPVYAAHSACFLSRVAIQAFGTTTEQSATIWRNFVDGFFFYWKTVFASFQSLYVFLSVVGFIRYFGKEKVRTGFFVIWFLVSLVLVSFGHFKTNLYAIPLLIPLSLYAGYAIEEVLIRKAELLKVLVVAWGLGTVLHFSFPETQFGILKESVNKDISYYPRTEDWKLGAIVDYLKENISPDRPIPSVHVGADLYSFSAMTLSYTAVLEGIKMRFSGSGESYRNILSCDFIIVKSGDNQGLYYKPQWAQGLLRGLEQRADVWKPGKVFKLPDGSEATVFKRIKKL